LIPSDANSPKPAAKVVLDPKKLKDDYEIAFGFYYRYMFRNPVRVELELSRKEWLGIAGLTENGDYGEQDSLGDRKMTVF